jgi:hypothetical protein
MNFIGGRLAIMNFLGGSLAICRIIKVPKIAVLQQEASISEVVEMMQALVVPTAPITTTLLPDDIYQVPTSTLTYLIQLPLVVGRHPEAPVTVQPKQLKPSVRGYYWIIIDPEPNYHYEKQWENRKFKDKSLPTVIEEISQEISHVTGKQRIKKFRLQLKTSSNRKEVVKEAVVHKGDEDL